MKNAGSCPAFFWLRSRAPQGRVPTALPGELLELPLFTAGALDPEAPIAVPVPSPPWSPVPGWAVWLRPFASVLPLPLAPGTASPPDEPVCAAEPATPDGPPGGPSGAAGRTA